MAMMTLSAKDLQLELWLRKRESGELKWTTKEGIEIPLKDMSNKHIENCLNLMERIEVFNDAAAEFLSKDWGDM